MMNDMMMMYEYDVIGINQFLCLPKAKLNTKNAGWVFGVQHDSLEKSVSSNTENRADFIPTFLDT